MATRKTKVAVALFDNAGAARKAVDELVAAGFRKNQIGVVSPDGKGTETLPKGEGSKWEEGAVAGVATGAGVGALWALGIAAGLLPGIGPAIAGGLLASVLASAAGGAAVAGLVGALIGLGIPEEDARYYEEQLKSGRTLVTVKAATRYDEAVLILTRNGGYTRSQGAAVVTTTTATTTSRKVAATAVPATVTTTATTSTGEATQAMEVRHEEARVRKTPRKKGEVRVRKEVVTDTETVTVPVEREEVVIERRPAGRRKSTAVVQEGEEIRIPVKEEEVRIEKDVVVDEEVTVGKRKVRDTKTVSTPVRREKVKVEQVGETEVIETGTRKKRS